VIVLMLAAANGPAPRSEPTPQIVVTGQRLEDTEAALRACLARHCPPDQDINASLAHAENQLTAGRYHEARKTLLSALGRNRGQAKTYPVAVSDLYRASGQVAAHLGLDQSYLASTLSIYDALKAGLPKDDYRLYQARMEIAGMLGRLRGHEAARRAYADLARDARKQGRPDIAAMAELRSILNHYPPEMRAKMIRAIADSRDPAMRAAVLEARLALINVARAAGDMEQVAVLTRDLAGLNPARPVLIYSPPYELVIRDLPTDTNVLGVSVSNTMGSPETRLSTSASFSDMKRLSGNFDDKWIDVGFWVTPEGKVDDLKVLRKKGDIFWADPLLESIRNRLYTPGNGNAADSYRVERYTYTAGYDERTGSHLQQRTPKARIEYLDLTGDGLAAPH
jgi:hypothetical protein